AQQQDRDHGGHEPSPVRLDRLGARGAGVGGGLAVRRALGGVAGLRRPLAALLRARAARTRARARGLAVASRGLRRGGALRGSGGRRGRRALLRARVGCRGRVVVLVVALVVSVGRFLGHGGVGGIGGVVLGGLRGGLLPRERLPRIDDRVRCRGVGVGAVRRVIRRSIRSLGVLCARAVGVRVRAVVDAREIVGV